MTNKLQQMLLSPLVRLKQSCATVILIWCVLRYFVFSFILPSKTHDHLDWSQVTLKLIKTFPSGHRKVLQLSVCLFRITRKPCRKTVKGSKQLCWNEQTHYCPNTLMVPGSSPPVSAECRGLSQAQMNLVLLRPWLSTRTAGESAGPALCNKGVPWHETDLKAGG